MRVFKLRLVCALGLVGFIGPGASANEPDPRAAMARALEEQADVSPAPPVLPEPLTRNIKALPPPAKGVEKDAMAAARADAVKAAVRAAVAEVARVVSKGPPPWAPAAEAARDAESHGRSEQPHPGKAKGKGH